MKTTIDLPDDLVKAAKLRAVNENRRLKDVVADALRRGLSESTERPDAPPQHRVRLPLIDCAAVASPDQEITPDRVHEILLADEAAGLER